MIQCSSILKEKLSHPDHIKMIHNYIRLYFILLPVILSLTPSLHQTQLHSNSSKCSHDSCVIKYIFLKCSFFRGVYKTLVAPHLNCLLSICCILILHYPQEQPDCDGISCSCGDTLAQSLLLIPT